MNSVNSNKLAQSGHCSVFTVLDTNPEGPEVNIDIAGTSKLYQQFAPHVEKNAGLSVLVIREGLTLNQLVQIAAKRGMTVSLPKDYPELHDVPAAKTYAILISDGLINGSRNLNFDQQKTHLSTHGFEIPTFLEYVALGVLTLKEETRNCSWGYSSTSLHGLPLLLGCHSRNRSLDTSHGDFRSDELGARGKVLLKL